MSFVSWQYALFLPTVVLLYWRLPWRGRIVEQESFDELLRCGGVFAEMAARQDISTETSLILERRGLKPLGKFPDFFVTSR